MNGSPKLTIKNDNMVPKLIVLEPWADEYVLSAGEKLELVFDRQPQSIDMIMEQRANDEMYTRVAGSNTAAIDTIVLWIEGGSIVEVSK